MNNKIILGLNLAVALIVVYLLFKSFTKEDKIGYIDSMRLFSKYEGMKEAQESIEKKTKGFEMEVDSAAQEMEASLRKFEKERTSLSAREVKLSEEVLRNKQGQFMQFQKVIEQKIQEEQGKVQEALLKKINAFVKKYGEDHHYKFIIGANNSGNLLYADEATDLTEDVLKKINAEYKKGE